MNTFFLSMYQLLFLPHLILFYQSQEYHTIVEDLYSISEIPNSKFIIAKDLTRQLASNKYFRTLFYFRTKGVFSNILRVFFVRDNRFIIDINTKIKGGVILAHPYSTILNADSIGKNLYINQLVTVGEKEGKKPKIGDNVKLYSNCTVIGNITIGNYAIIGAGAVVVKDVPDNCVVVGNPGKIIRINGVKIN